MTNHIQNLWSRGYRDRLHEVCQEIAGKHITQGGVYADFGVGDGVLFEKLQNIVGARQAVACDLCLSGKGHLNRYLTVQMDFNSGRLPFRDSVFDFVSHSNVFEHLFRPEDFLCEMKRVLKPGGRLLLATNNISNWTNILSLLFGKQPNALHASDFGDFGRLFQSDELCPTRELRHRRLYSLAALQCIVRFHGFEIVLSRYCVFYPFSGMVEKVAERLFGIYSAYLVILARKAP